MKHSLFSVYDEKAKAFLPIFMLPREELAERVFGDCVNSRDHQFGKHPEDYTLYVVGEFDDSTGVVSPKEKGRLLGNGRQFVVPVADGLRVVEEVA